MNSLLCYSTSGWISWN